MKVVHKIRIHTKDASEDCEERIEDEEE
jgi:hypothetical protein